MPTTKNTYPLAQRNDWARVGNAFRLVLSFMLVCFRCRQCSRLQGCVVAGTGADQQTSTIQPSCLYFDDPIRSVPLPVRGDIGKGVLIADIVSDAFTDTDNIL